MDQDADDHRVPLPRHADGSLNFAKATLRQIVGYLFDVWSENVVDEPPEADEHLADPEAFPANVRPSEEVVQCLRKLELAVKADPTGESPQITRRLNRSIRAVYGSLSAWDRLMTDLRDEDLDRSVAAFDKLEQVADESWLPQLHDLLVHAENFYVRSAAIGPIIRLQGIAALPQLLHGLRLDVMTGSAMRVADLAEAHPAEAVPVLLEMFANPDVEIRDQAGWLWAFLKESVEPTPLFDLARDPNAELRSRAASSLCSFKQCPEVFPVLVQLLNDDNEKVRSSAASSLGYFGDVRAIPELERRLNDPAKEVREWAQRALDELRKK